MSKFFKSLTLGHWLAVFFIFATIGLAISLFSLPKSSQPELVDSIATKTVEMQIQNGFAATKTAELQNQIDESRKVLHDSCLRFLMPAFNDGGATIDVDRLSACKEYFLAEELTKVLNYQALRASGKLSVFVAYKPFDLIYMGRKYVSNYSDGIYSLVFDPIGKIDTVLMLPYGDVIPEVADTTVIIYPSDYK